LADGSGYPEGHRGILRELQTQRVQHRNQSGGYWIADANPAPTAQATTVQRPVINASAAILATSGA